MAAQATARASPELREAPLSPRYRWNYTTSRGTTVSGGNATLGRDLGGKGKGTASVVSGGGTGGWGNEGSVEGVAGAGGQVSNRGGERGR